MCAWRINDTSQRTEGDREWDDNATLAVLIEKAKRKRAATAILVVGVLITASGVYGFARGGAEMLGVWGLGLGGFLTVIGVALLMRVAKSR